MMRTKSICASLFLVIVAPGASGAMGNLAVYDDAVQNFVDCSDSTHVSPPYFLNSSPVHSGMYSIRMQDYQLAEVGFCGTATYSIASDYNGISFWVNGGTLGGEDVHLVLYDDMGASAIASLAALYGAAIPANTWVHIQTSFSSPVFDTYLGDATTFNQIAFRVESNTSNMVDYFFLDDISLIGADIFKSGFEN